MHGDVRDMKTPMAFLAAALLQVSVPSLGAAPADEAGSHVARAKAAAGSEYEVLVRALCPGQAPASDVSVRPEQRDTGYRPPAKVFDGLRTLGLDPASIRYVIVTHGHRDHSGGAKALQERGARIALSETDWALLEQTQGALVKRDLVIDRRQRITLGDTSVDVVPTPGHTPGTLSLIFPVHDGGARHVVAIWGGTGFNTRTQEQFSSYAESARRFAELTRTAGVDVPLSNHPIVDQTFAKLALLESRKPGDVHPFVRGWASQHGLLATGAECAEAQLLSGFH